jgi:pimeloyl-ACP methyl ester carboxylesterase
MKSFRSFDGLEMSYLDEGDGPLVVLLHGFASEHQGNWVAPGVVGALLDAGHRVVAPDARGHGRSAAPHDADAYSDDAMVRDVHALFDHLGSHEIDLAGYSMGSIMGATVTTRDDRVRRLVLGGVGGSWRGDQRPQDGAALAEALEADDPASVTNPVAAAFRRFADTTGADRLALAACQRSSRGSRADVGTISVPTLVLTGDRDTLVGSPEELAARIPGATSRTLRGTHLSAVADPDFASAIVAFFSPAT